MNGRILAGVGNGAASGALWGLVFLMPQVLGDFGATQLSAARYLVYGIASLLILSAKRKRGLPALGRRDWATLFRLSLFGNILYYLFLATAIQLVGGPPSTLINSLLPVVVVIVGSREKGALPLKRLAGPILLCVAGVAIIGMEAVLRERTGRSLPVRVLGLGCAFASLASWTAYSVGNSRALAARPDVSAHDWSLFIGLATGSLSLLLVPAAFFMGGSAAHGGAAHGSADWSRFWMTVSAVAVLASIAGNSFWNRASRLLPLTLSGQMIVFETIFALLYGFIWERRLPTAAECAAIALLLTGVLWGAAVHDATGRAGENSKEAVDRGESELSPPV